MHDHGCHFAGNIEFLCSLVNEVVLHIPMKNNTNMAIKRKETKHTVVVVVVVIVIVSSGSDGCGRE